MPKIDVAFGYSTTKNRLSLRIRCKFTSTSVSMKMRCLFALVPLDKNVAAVPNLQVLRDGCCGRMWGIHAIRDQRAALAVGKLDDLTSSSVLFAPRTSCCAKTSEQGGKLSSRQNCSSSSKSESSHFSTFLPALRRLLLVEKLGQLLSRALELHHPYPVVLPDFIFLRGDSVSCAVTLWVRPRIGTPEDTAGWGTTTVEILSNHCVVASVSPCGP